MFIRNVLEVFLHIGAFHIVACCGAALYGLGCGFCRHARRGAFGASAGLEDVDVAGAAAGERPAFPADAAAAAAGVAPVSVVSGVGGADFTAVQADSAHKVVKEHEARGARQRAQNIRHQRNFDEDGILWRIVAVQREAAVIRSWRKCFGAYADLKSFVVFQERRRSCASLSALPTLCRAKLHPRSSTRSDDADSSAQ